MIKVLVLYNIDLGWADFEISDARNSNKVLFESLKNEGVEAYLEELDNPELEKILGKYNPADTIVFNLCEALPGIPGSETKVLEIIGNRGFAYTGNSAKAIELSYDKQKVKELLAHSGIAVPPGAVLTPEESLGWNLFPAIVKPACEHCSLSVSEKSVVYDKISLKNQIIFVNNELGQPALVEDFIDGREFHVSVWNNNPPEALPAAEMDFSAFVEQRKRLCTYESKFIPGSEHYEKITTLLPAPLNEEELKNLEDMVRAAWKGIGCRDYARFDLRLRSGRFYLLDVNPNNDIGYDTSFALAAEIKGYSYGQAVKRIVMMAAKRMER